MNRLDRPRIVVPLALLIQNRVARKLFCLSSSTTVGHDAGLSRSLACFSAPSTSAPGISDHSSFVCHNRAAHRATVWRTLQLGVRLQQLATCVSLSPRHHYNYHMPVTAMALVASA